MNPIRLILLSPLLLLLTACPSYTCQDEAQTACTVEGAPVCTDLQRDRRNCGACGVTCAFEEACSEGACVPCEGGDCGYDVVAACSTNGQVVGLQAGTDLVGNPVAVGPNRPLALAPLREVLLVPDFDGVLSQVRKSDLATVGGTAQVGEDARFIATEDPFVYVVSSVTGTVQVFEAGAQAEGAYPLTLRSELPLSESDQGNTYAQGVVKVGSLLYIPLQGGFGDAAAQGQKVLKVDVSDPGQPSRAGFIDLTSIDLKPFEGETTLPRPADIVHHGGALYVTLANWNANYAPGGPGMLAKISLPGEEVTAIDLGADVCLSASYVESDGDRLYVSCSGRVVYGGAPDFAIVEAEKAGLVVVGETDQRLGTWASQPCPEEATDCIVPVPSRFAVRGNEVYLGDQNGGRMYVLNVDSEGALTERRGDTVPAGPIEVCAVRADSAVSNVIDVVALP